MENNNMPNREALNMKWDKDVNNISRYSGIIAILLMLMVPFVITLVYAENIDIAKTISTVLAIMSVFAPVAVAENLSLYPILGVGGLVLSVITGNVSNMKLPAATSGMKIANAEIGTPEAEVAAILSVGSSAIITTIIVFLGMIFGTQLAPVLSSPVLAPGFAVVLPALLGAMAIPIFVKTPKQSIVPFVFAAIVFLIMGKAAFTGLQGVIIIITMIVNLVAVRVMYNKGIIKPKK